MPFLSPSRGLPGEDSGKEGREEAPGFVGEAGSPAPRK